MKHIKDRRSGSEGASRILSRLGVASVFLASFFFMMTFPPLDAYPQHPDAERIGRLMSELKDRDADVRWKSADALVVLGETAVPALVRALSDNDPDTRRIIVDVLVRIGKPSVEALIAALKDTNPGVRLASVEALGRIGDNRADDHLIAALKDSDPSVREKAVQTMLKIRNPASVEPLIEAIRDSNQYVSEGAIEVLGRLKDERAVRPIAADLNNKNPRIRKIASDAMWEMRGLDEVRSLINLMKSTAERYNAMRGDARKYVDMKNVPRYGGITKEEYDDIQAINENIRTLSKSYSLFIRSGAVDAEGILVVIFNKYGDRQMANDFLNCGNARLMQTAYKWIQDNMHSLNIDTGTVGPRWGRK